MEEQERLMQDAIDQAYRHTLELQSICASAGAEFSAGQDQEGMAHRPLGEMAVWLNRL